MLKIASGAIVLFMLLACNGGEKYSQEKWGNVEVQVSSARIVAVWGETFTLAEFEGAPPPQGSEVVLGFGEEAVLATGCGQDDGGSLTCDVVSGHGARHPEWRGRRVSVRYRR